MPARCAGHRDTAQSTAFKCLSIGRDFALISGNPGTHGRVPSPVAGCGVRAGPNSRQRRALDEQADVVRSGRRGVTRVDGRCERSDQDRGRGAVHGVERDLRRADQEGCRAGGGGPQRQGRHPRPEDRTGRSATTARDPKEGVSVANKFVGDKVTPGARTLQLGRFDSRVRSLRRERHPDDFAGVDQSRASPSAACGTRSAPAAATISRARSPART